jgi:hypothetical protein
VNERALLTTNPRKDERCACGSFAAIRFGTNRALCEVHFVKAFSRAAWDSKIQALVDLAAINGYIEVLYPRGMGLRDIAEAYT